MAAVLVGIAVRDRQEAIRLASAYTAKGEPQETELDTLQIVPYGVALLVCGTMIVLLAVRHERRPQWILLAVVSVWLLWRELPYDEQLLGVNTFSWAKYLAKPGLPLGMRIAFFAVSFAFAVGLAAYLVVRRREVLAMIREKILSLSFGLLVLAGGSLLAAQAVDKHRGIDSLLAVGLSAWDLRDYCEESLELAGATLLAMSCLMAVLEEPPRKGSTAPSRAAARPSSGGSA